MSKDNRNTPWVLVIIKISSTYGLEKLKRGKMTRHLQMKKKIKIIKVMILISMS